MLKETPSLGQAGRPIERIILYVDDLDRCPAERVGEVLQAVHLLLAFDLFIVVVGVDPRWLMHALEETFPAFRSKTSTGDPVADSWLTTPQNYLEKIFQIPFTLRPMNPTGLGKLIRALLPDGGASTEEREEREGLPEPQTQPEAMTNGSEENRGNGSQPQPTPSQANLGSAAPQASADAQPGRAAEAERTPHLEPEALVIRPWEQDFAERLYEFIPTPRAAKRVTNIYRLLKAPLSGDELKAFEGTATRPGDFRAPMLLLAMLTGFPEAAERLFAGALSAPNRHATPDELFASVDELELPQEARERFSRCVEPLLSDGLVDSVETYLDWIPRVARFSFRSARALPQYRAGQLGSP